MQSQLSWILEGVHRTNHTFEYRSTALTRRCITAEMKLLLIFLSSLLVLRGMAVDVIRNYNYVSKAMNWFDAQTYCRLTYTDLAFITTDEEDKRAIKVAGDLLVYAWIGINRTMPYSDSWQLSDGEPAQFFKWHDGEPNNMRGIENCAGFLFSLWNDFNCLARFPFFCHQNFILVTEGKTWEEALAYCRTYHAGLVCVDDSTDHFLNAMWSIQNSSVNIWLGLIFRNGNWLSTNRKLVGSLDSLPSCPAQRCGTYNTMTNALETRNCNEKLSFVCY